MEITTGNEDQTKNLILDGINDTIQKTCGLSQIIFVISVCLHSKIDASLLMIN